MGKSIVEFEDRKGAANSASKLTDTEVQEIRALLKTNVSQASIAKVYGVTPALVSLLKHKRIWGHLPEVEVEAPVKEGLCAVRNASKRQWHLDKLREGTHSRQKLMPRDIRRIRERLATGEVQSDVAKSYGVSRSLITHIKSGVSWQWLEEDKESEGQVSGQMG